MANFITLMRLPFLVIFLLLLYTGNPVVQLWSIVLLVVILLMDTLDGTTARIRKEVTLLGSVLDIAVDRAVEFSLWVVFADLRLIPVIVPLVIIMRGVTVDAVRAVGLEGGTAPFQQVRAPLSQFLVGSPIMRTGYGVAKGIAFILLTWDLGLHHSSFSPLTLPVHDAAQVLTWLAVMICLARGLPVLVEGFRFLKTQN